jgi:hypothetical protein
VRRSLVAGAQQGDVQDRGRAEIGVAELALDHVERHALARELDGMRVAQLVRRGAAPDSAAPKPAATACSIEPKRSLATSRNCCAPSARRPGATPPGKDYTR